MFSRTCIAMALIAALAPAFAEGEPGTAGWTKVVVTPGVLPAELEPMGFFDGFEKLIEDGVFTAYGHRVKLDLAGAQPSWSAGGAAVPIRQFPALATFGAEGARRAVWIHHRGATYTWSSHYGARFALDGKTFAIVDADADGVLWEVNEDGLVGPLSMAASPFVGEAWTETAGFKVATKDGAPWSAPAAMPRPGQDPLNAGWMAFNAWRMAGGSTPSVWDETVHKACLAHIDYCIANGVRGHEETEGNAHYTEAGAQAGKDSVLSFGHPVPRDAILEQISTAYHLSAVLSPACRISALAIRGSTFAANVKGDTSGESRSGAVTFVWPPHGGRDFPRMFNGTGEIPMPIPNEEGDYKKPLGQAILAQVSGDGPFALEVVSDKGEVVQGTLTTPDASIEGVSNNHCLVILAPHKALASNARYTATLRLTEGEASVVRVWRFQTGAAMYRVVCHGGGGGESRPSGRPGRRPRD